MKEQIPRIIELLRIAGGLIMDVYRTGEPDMQIQWKADLSPLTLADRRSHDYVCEQLNRLDASIPVMSEESTEIPFSLRSTWRRYWCLDPLDGTKEFINRNDQFTINLALMEDNRPTLGFIHVPVSGHTYWALLGEGAFCYDGYSSASISSNKKDSDWIALASSSHGSDDEKEVLREFPVTRIDKVGSALKFCHIASGRADVYFRSGPTMEWDTAAGHILVEEAGAQFRYLTDSAMNYNKESLLNPSFLVHIPR
jgi:3'(2'), 5'-bisphosphate nucleotidase